MYQFRYWNMINGRIPELTMGKMLGFLTGDHCILYLEKSEVIYSYRRACK